MNTNNLQFYNLDNFNVINNDDLMNVDGGFIITVTGSAVVAGITALGGGVAFGYAVGKILRKIF